MTEPRPFKETACPWLAVVAIIKWGTIYDFNDEGGVSKSSMKGEVRCMGENCQMFNLNFRGCGLRWR